MLTDSRSHELTRVLPPLTDGTHAYSLCQSGEHRSKRSNSQGLFVNFFLAPLPFAVTHHRRDAGSWRIGSFLLDSPQMLLMGKLPVPKWLPPDLDDVQAGIAMMGACKLHNARPGIWITGMVPAQIPWTPLRLCRPS